MIPDDARVGPSCASDDVWNSKLVFWEKREGLPRIEYERWDLSWVKCGFIGDR